MMTANEIRDSYLKFFESKGHVIVPSAPIVVKDDPTLMFTNAGMNQWKDIILGTKDPNPWRRTDSQKCLRVSGKHNDLEEVGRDAALSHHTMFEMLGNWSFGDYFKEGAIDYAYEYLVDVLHLDPKDLYVTVFEGDANEHLDRDDEALGYWAYISPPTISSMATSTITSGRWVTQAPAVPARRSISTSARRKRRRKCPVSCSSTKIIHRSSRSGTSCSCSSTVRPTVLWNR